MIRIERQSTALGAQNPMEWYQKASRALEVAVAENQRNIAEDEEPPTKESIDGVDDFLKEASEALSAIAIPKISISSEGAINLRWKVSNGRIDVSFSGSGMQAFESSNAQKKALERSEVPGRVLTLLA
jgi:hypothetical protein